MEWFKKNKKIVIGVLVVVVLACIGLGAYLVSRNGEPKKANKENTEKMVKKQEDSEEVQDEEQVTENVDTETVVDDTTQTETDEVAEETTETTQPSTSANDTTSNSNNTTNNNTTSENTTSSNSTSNNSTNSGSTTNNSNSGNTTNSGNSGSTANSDSTTNSGSTTGKPSDGMVNAMGTPLTPKQAAAVNAGYYKVATSSQGYSLVVPSHLEYDKGCKIIYDYIESLGYERAGASSAYITEGYYGIYVDYENLHKIPTEDDIILNF